MDTGSRFSFLRVHEHFSTLRFPSPPALFSNPQFPSSSSNMKSLMQFAFVLHLVIGTTAAINFFVRPSATLSTSQPHSHGLIRQYALLLLATNIIVAVFLNRAMDDALSGQVAAALSLYHVGLSVRAVSRIRGGNSGDVLGGPWLHAFAHSLCAACLMASFVSSSL